MNYKAGDKVKFLHEKGNGVITRILNNNMVMVEDENGFETPIFADQLVKTEDSPKKEMSSQTTSYKEAKKGDEIKLKDPELNEKVILAILPNTAMDSRIALLNNSSYNAICLLGLEKENFIETLANCELEPGAYIDTDTFSNDKLMRSHSLHLQIMFCKEETYHYKKPLDFSIGMSQMMQLKITSNAYFSNEAGFIEIDPDQPSKMQSLSNTEINERLKEKGDFIIQPPKKKPQAESEIVEVDLHIEALIDHFKTLTNAEILKIQLDQFEKTLNKAIVEKKKRIIFIHGVGNGTLKFELRRALSNKYSSLQYQDASFAEYGFGATMVII